MNDKMETDEGKLLVLVDVGGLGGIPKEWEAVHDRILPVVFEPNPSEAAPLHAGIRAGELPRPDVLKVDVQDLEYDVLLGFGELLGNCLGICFESQLYPIYRGQKLLGDIVDLLSRFGLVLRRIVPSHHFDGDIVEVDAWFTVDRSRERSLDPLQREKLRLIHDVWALAERNIVFGTKISSGFTSTAWPAPAQRVA